MQEYKRRFSFAKFVSDIVQQLIRPLDGLVSGSSHPKADSEYGSWCDIHSHNPQLYFSLLFSLDFYLSYGKATPLGVARPVLAEENSSQQGGPLAGALHKSTALETLLLLPSPSTPFQIGPDFFANCPLTVDGAGTVPVSPTFSNPQHGLRLSSSQEENQLEEDADIPQTRSDAPSTVRDGWYVDFNGIERDGEEVELEADDLAFLLQYSCPCIG